MVNLRNFSLISGIGKDKYNLVSFDKALFNSGIGNFNIVKVSSILPPRCVFKKNIDAIDASILYCAFSTMTINYRTIISSAVAVGIPVYRKNIGVIMEYSGDCSVKESLDKAIEMVNLSMLVRKIEIANILTSSIEYEILSKNEYCTVFSGLVMW